MVVKLNIIRHYIEKRKTNNQRREKVALKELVLRSQILKYHRRLKATLSATQLMMEVG